jgi:hypothetical protein
MSEVYLIHLVTAVETKPGPFEYYGSTLTNRPPGGPEISVALTVLVIHTVIFCHVEVGAIWGSRLDLVD